MSEASKLEGRKGGTHKSINWDISYLYLCDDPALVMRRMKGLPAVTGAVTRQVGSSRGSSHG